MRVIACLILSAGALSSGGAQAGLLAPAAPQETDLLSVDAAFRPRAALLDGGTLTLGLDIAPGCYLYRDKLSVQVLEPTGVRLGEPRFSASERHHDEHFGDVDIFRNAVEVSLKPAAGTPRKLQLRYQGCAENKVCYPPQTRVIDVITP